MTTFFRRHVERSFIMLLTLWHLILCCCCLFDYKPLKDVSELKDYLECMYTYGCSSVWWSSGISSEQSLWRYRWSFRRHGYPRPDILRNCCFKMGEFLPWCWWILIRWKSDETLDSSWGWQVCDYEWHDFIRYFYWDRQTNNMLWWMNLSPNNTYFMYIS